MKLETDHEYVEFMKVGYSVSGTTVRYRFALNAEAAAKIAALPPQPHNSELVDLLLDNGAVLHDEIADGVRKPAFTVTTNGDRDLLKASHYQYGKLDDPAPGVPAVIKFGSAYDSLIDHFVAICSKDPYPNRPSRDTLAERYRAYFNMGEPHDPDGEPSEQSSNPRDLGKSICYGYKQQDSIWSAYSAAKKRYLRPDELKSLNEKKRAQRLAETPQNNPYPIFRI
jgi:hypothetical protein